MGGKWRDMYVPSGTEPSEAWENVTHLGIGAHADDLEFMAYHGIEACRHGAGAFGGIVVTDGAGSVWGEGESREELCRQRQEEQREAARIGSYAVMAQLGFSSEEAKKRENVELAEALDEVLQRTSPQVIYTHNPADRHDTHVAVCLQVIEALRRIPKEKRPQRVYGCEVWRDLDWLTGADRVRLDCGRDEAFAMRLNRVFRSQIEAGKRYDLAVIGRRRAQATFDEPRAHDEAEMLTLAMDMTPLLQDEKRSVADFVLEAIDRFREDVRERLT